MSDNNNNNRGYNPEHERTCRGCYKVLKTKEGVLENKYKFTCSPCHQWYKNASYWGWGIGIGVGVIFLILLLGIYIKLDKKENENYE